jgi:MFS family permease
VRFPLVAVPLLRERGFAAATTTVFLLGAALFGSMILLPLYYQVARGQSPLEAGLLVAPQGIGAALGMNVGGRMTDRFGAGRVVPFGLLLLTAGTAIFAFVGPDTSYWALTAGLLLRGVGLGASMMPAMAGAYATIKRHEVPRATPMLNVIQRVGGSLGVAIFTVVLQNQLDSATHDPAGAASSFAHTYRWATIASLVAVIPALVLAREERRAREVAARAAAAAEAEAPAEAARGAVVAA